MSVAHVDKTNSCDKLFAIIVTLRPIGIMSDFGTKRNKAVLYNYRKIIPQRVIAGALQYKCFIRASYIHAICQVPFITDTYAA